MPQHEIANHLKKHRGKKFTVAQLSTKMGYGKGAICCSVQKLIRFNLVKSEVTKEKHQSNVNGHKYPCMRTVRKIWL